MFLKEVSKLMFVHDFGCPIDKTNTFYMETIYKTNAIYMFLDLIYKTHVFGR